MDRYGRILVWLLRVFGVIMLTALGAVVMPYEWMNVIHQKQGLGELLHVPIVGYLTRSISALYALHGAVLVFVASDLRRYVPVVRFLAIVGTVFGTMMLAINWGVEVALSWTIREGSWVILLGGVMFWLSGRQPFTTTPVHSAFSGL